MTPAATTVQMNSLRTQRPMNEPLLAWALPDLAAALAAFLLAFLAARLSQIAMIASSSALCSSIVS